MPRGGLLISPPPLWLLALIILVKRMSTDGKRTEGQGEEKVELERGSGERRGERLAGGVLRRYLEQFR